MNQKQRSKRLKYLPWAVASLFLAAISCRDKQQLIADNGDPYLACFYGKGIKYMTIRQPSGIKDTLWFNKAGDIIFIKSYGKTERLAYDENHFLIRQLMIGDMTKNCVINYYHRQDTIVQKWMALEHDRWSLNKDDTTYTSVILDKIILNNQGQFEKVISKNSGVVIHFSYGLNDRISKRQTFSLVDNKTISTWTYEYDANNTLIKIQFSDDSATEFEYHFKNGLPEFIQYNDQRNYRKTYEYFY